MTDYEQLVKALRCIELRLSCNECEYGKWSESGEAWSCDFERRDTDAADAIEELEKELEIWTARSFEGKIGSMALINLNLRMEISKLKAQLPKRGKWIRIDKHTVQCPLCHRYLDLRGVNAGRGDANYCPNCGAKMEVQNDY